MAAYGFTLSSEEHDPLTLVRLAERAEAEGFDFLSISDHFHPWVSAQGHSPFVWSVLGGVAARTERVEVAVGVTCPILRVHPSIVAHAAATVARMLPGRFSLGVGTGEALNEHITGQRWPAVDIRRAMLDEAVAVMRELWSGEVVTHRGEHYVVEQARLFDPPDHELPVIVSAFGPAAAELAGRIGDGLWTSGDPEVLEAYERAGGAGPRYAQVKLCWAEREDEARETVHRLWPTSAVPGQLSQDLPTYQHFEWATSNATMEMTTSSTPCGPDPQPVLEKIQQLESAGIDHIHLHQIGPDQEGFFRFWGEQLRPALQGQAAGGRR